MTRILKDQPRPELNAKGKKVRVSPAAYGLHILEVRDLLILAPGDPGTESTSLGQPARIIKAVSAYSHNSGRKFVCSVKDDGEIHVWREK